MGSYSTNASWCRWWDVADSKVCEVCQREAQPIPKRRGESYCTGCGLTTRHCACTPLGRLKLGDKPPGIVHQRFREG